MKYMSLSKALSIAIISITMVSCGEKGKKQMNDPVIVKDDVLVMETTQGPIEIKLMPKVAPKACENITRLAEQHYYDGVSFHRIIPNFMIQGGDPEGTGRGGASVWGTPFEDEYATGVVFDRPGLLAMANRGPGTNGSQFFITTVATPHLNNKHTIFGEVVSGFDVVKKIEAMGTFSGTPKSPQKIIRMYIKKA